MSGHVDRSNISNPPQEYLIPPNLTFLTMICFTFLELLQWPPFLNSQCPTQKMDFATYHIDEQVFLVKVLVVELC